MTQKWKPSDPVDPTDRAYFLAALEAIRHSVNAAELDDDDEHDEDAQTWAMRILQSLDSVEEDLRWVRSHLARVAQDAGLGTREIARVLDVSAPTVARMTRNARDAGIPPGLPTLWHLNTTGEDDPGADRLEVQLEQNGIPGDIAASVRDALASRQDARSPLVYEADADNA
ncbi:hypothetical protein [Isoptericola rhizosphaerae]|uniref:hypothetical protein n=1 Tax=Isoptericola rhizosphaerae TaxID=3377837 RepID=UPI00383A95C0